MIDGKRTDAWVIGLGFTITLNANQSWKVFEALKGITTNLQPSKRVGILGTTNGQGFIILVHELANAPTPNLIARKLAGELGNFTAEQIEPLLDVHIFPGDNKEERVDNARRYVANHPELFEGEVPWRVDLQPPEPEPFVEPEPPPEGWPILQPLEWVEVEIEVII